MWLEGSEKRVTESMLNSKANTQILKKLGTAGSGKWELYNLYVSSFLG